MNNSERITIKEDNKPIYDIVLARDYNLLQEELKALSLSGRKVCIVTDSTVSRLHLSNLLEIVKDYARVVETFTFEAGEKSKNLSVVSQLYEKLIHSKFDRNDMLFALGGGVVGDLTGFAAATYLRGIPFIQIPTTLLACVDSSIGGKTGVDFKAYKNMVGAFHQPKLVYINLSHLNTLEERQLVNGMGEVIKHGLIKDLNYYHTLKACYESLLNKEPSVVMDVVARSCMIKKEVVETDPTEKGIRALLNFGHTIGHAVERCLDFNLLHGECVAIGMVAASYLSFMRGNLSLQEVEKIKETISSYHLPIALENKEIPAEDILEAVYHDKKVDGDSIKFILLKNKGEAVIDSTVTREEIKKAIEYILPHDKG